MIHVPITCCICASNVIFMFVSAHLCAQCGTQCLFIQNFSAYGRTCAYACIAVTQASVFVCVILRTECYFASFFPRSGIKGLQGKGNERHSVLHQACESTCLFSFAFMHMNVCFHKKQIETDADSPCLIRTRFPKENPALNSDVM